MRRRARVDRLQHAFDLEFAFMIVVVEVVFTLDLYGQEPPVNDIGLHLDKHADEVLAQNEAVFEYRI